MKELDFLNELKKEYEEAYRLFNIYKENGNKDLEILQRGKIDALQQCFHLFNFYFNG